MKIRDIVDQWTAGLTGCHCIGKFLQSYVVDVQRTMALMYHSHQPSNGPPFLPAFDLNRELRAASWLGFAAVTLYLRACPTGLPYGSYPIAFDQDYAVPSRYSAVAID
jgi:hypothetical protein